MDVKKITKSRFKKEGFTLIELLAVILILGIIALIAVPTVNSVVKQAKKGAFEATMSEIVKSVETNCQILRLNGESAELNYSFFDGNVTPSLDVKGILPTSGTISTDENCNILVSNVSDGTFVANKSINSDVIVVEEVLVSKNGPTYVKVNGETYIGVLYFDPTNINTYCDSSNSISKTGVNSGCMKWYIYNDNGNGTVDAILAHNTTKSVAWNSTDSTLFGPNEVISQLKKDTNLWSAIDDRNDTYILVQPNKRYEIEYTGFKARLITANEVARITKNEFDETKDFAYLDLSNSSWLYDYTRDCKPFGCKIEDNDTDAYWTATAAYNSSTNAMYVDSDADLDADYCDVNIYAGIRPVITINKSIYGG